MVEVVNYIIDVIIRLIIKRDTVQRGGIIIEDIWGLDTIPPIITSIATYILHTIMHVQSTIIMMNLLI